MAATSVTPESIATRLGEDPATLTPARRGQFSVLIADAVALISLREAQLGVVPSPEVVDLIVGWAVADAASGPADNATRVSVSVDDGSVAREYPASSRRITIRDDWWDMLGLGLAVLDGWTGSISYSRSA